MLSTQFHKLSEGLTGVVASLVVMLVVAAISAFSFVQIDRELIRTKTVESDNRTWVLAQIEVDVQRLEIALLKAGATPDAEALKGVRLAFDILYSRVDLVERSPLFNELRIPTTDTWLYLSGPQGLIETFLPLIDGPDEQLRAALPDMTRRALDFGLPIREIVVDAISETNEQSDIARGALQRTLNSFMVTLVVTMLALTILLVTIYRQARARRSYAETLELAVYNLRATIEASPDAVLVINAKDKVTGANKAGEQLIGRPIRTQDAIPLASLLDLGGTSGDTEKQRLRTRCHCEGRGSVPVEVTIATASTATGYRFKIAFLRDMTEQLSRERRLAEATELARRGEEAKDRFLAVMSHEMRTPLSGLLSATDLLESSTRLDDQQQGLMNIIRASALAALEQVNNVLELTRLAARDARDYPHSDFQVTEAISHQVRLYETLAARRGNVIRLDIRDTCPPHIHGPLQLLRRIVNNLLSNAIKFTRDGTIDVTLDASPSDRPGICRFNLAIRDTGIGIAPQDLERIFENFETVDSSYARMQDGTGLGLGIARLSAAAMGGDIRVESELGKGTSFFVTFEAEVLEGAPRPAETAPDEPDDRVSLKILLAEDNEINRDLMERQLSRLGHTVRTARDGLEAVEAATRERFDVILMDISMPRMDGIAATRALQQAGVLERTGAIALTAQTAPNRAQMLRDSGFAEVIIKPAHVLQIDQVMQRVVMRPVVDSSPDTPADEVPAPVLVDGTRLGELVEDVGTEMLGRMAEKFSRDLELAISGAAGALDPLDRERLGRIAHKISGGAAVLTMDLLAAALRDLETAAEAEPAERLRTGWDAVAPLGAESLGAFRAALAAG